MRVTFLSRAVYFFIFFSFLCLGAEPVWIEVAPNFYVLRDPRFTFDLDIAGDAAMGQANPSAGARGPMYAGHSPRMKDGNVSMGGHLYKKSGERYTTLFRQIPNPRWPGGTATFNGCGDESTGLMAKAYAQKNGVSTLSINGESNGNIYSKPGVGPRDIFARATLHTPGGLEIKLPISQNLNVVNGSNKFYMPFDDMEFQLQWNLDPEGVRNGLYDKPHPQRWRGPRRVKFNGILNSSSGRWTRVGAAGGLMIYSFAGGYFAGVAGEEIALYSGADPLTASDVGLLSGHAGGNTIAIGGAYLLGGAGAASSAACGLVAAPLHIAAGLYANRVKHLPDTAEISQTEADQMMPLYVWNGNWWQNEYNFYFGGGWRGLFR